MKIHVVPLLASLALLLSCSLPPSGQGGASSSKHSLTMESLPGSEFQIDTDANLVLDPGVPQNIDWGDSVGERQPDVASGKDDNSLGQGSKEDTPAPAVVTGSIPPNKSDLLNFGVYLEDTGTQRFLHMFWHRVQDPSGTTNMDFEFNQSGQVSSNGVTMERTSGDLLIQYDLANGGTKPELFLSQWIDGSKGETKDDCEAANKLPCWSTKDNLSASSLATGSINTSVIPAAENGGLQDGDISPRTFGEATVDFDAIVSKIGANKCISFGSAFLKSRSSDSFTAALKDFIAPLTVNITNCGIIKVTKKDDAGNLLNGASFDLVKDVAPVGGSPGAGDTEVVDSCITGEDGVPGVCEFVEVFKGDYWVIETAAPAGHDLAGEPYKHVSVLADVTVQLYFENPRHRGAIVVTKLRKHVDPTPGTYPHPDVPFTVHDKDGNLVAGGNTDAAGTVCFDNLLLGDYTVTEQVPANYVADGDNPKTVTVVAKGSCADYASAAQVTFTNTPLSGMTVQFTPQVVGGTAATIDCYMEDGTPLIATTPDTDPTVFNDVSETFINLMPGTYNCTVVIDP